MQEMPFQRPKFQKISGGACPRTPLKLCRHYGLPITKILATPLSEEVLTVLTINGIVVHIRGMCLFGGIKRDVTRLKT